MSSVLLGILIVLACYDLKSRRLPNHLLFPTIIVGVFVQVISADWLSAVAGMGTAFLLTLFPVLLRGMGMGDQKLLMIVGAWTSPVETYQIFFYSILISAGSILLFPYRWSMVYHHLMGTAGAWHAHRRIWLPKVKDSALSMPYAVCLLLAYFVHGGLLRYE
ncbi:A24 family peptidase [Brevibacillus daliensis]|uniref:A24 family peptidase n=1 Tax=Brevibacillus daliensis TaxID=2892995 RepID=UPI001E392027|nr:A24 family peptidase [Brevibacillus daliensis]